MDQLRDREFRSLQELLPRIYALRDHETFGREVISLLPSLVGCDSCSYNELYLKNGVNQYISFPETPRLAHHRQIFSRHMHEHPLFKPRRYAGRRPRGAWKLSDVIGRKEFTRLGIYNEYFRPLGIEHQIGISVVPPDMQLLRAITVALNRSRPDFSERDRLRLTLLRPHLRQAYATAKQFSGMKNDLALFARGMDELNCALVLLYARGAVRYSSVGARRVLTEVFGGTALRNGQLPEDIERWLHEQENGEHLRARAPLVIQLGTTRIVVRCVAEPYGRLLFLDVEPRPWPSISELGLTPREAEVLQWTCRGKTNADIAAILDVSRRTVEKHLERIFPKLGVETRAAATSRVHQIARGPSTSWT